MKDIHEVLRIKQARYAQLAKQIEMLQQAAEKLREVAPLLAEIDDHSVKLFLRQPAHGFGMSTTGDIDPAAIQQRR